MPRQTQHAKMSYIYLILITIFCLSSTAQPVEPEHTYSATHPSGSGEIIADRQQHGSETNHRRTIITASNTTTTTMPTPYDTLSYNFANKTSCLNFYKNWRTNRTITNCHAISLLLENSNSFFHTLSSATSTSHVLDTSCAQNITTCSAIMKSLASDLLKPTNCGEDYDNGNSVVKGTYADLVAYEPMYRATCLTNPDTENYCFVDAVSNSTSPDDYDVYFVPLGNALGETSKPSCGRCLRASMDVFADWASVDGQPLDGSYLPSARVVNGHCGEGFAKTNVTVGSEVGAGVRRVSGVGVGVSVLLALWLV